MRLPSRKYLCLCLLVIPLIIGCEEDSESPLFAQSDPTWELIGLEGRVVELVAVDPSDPNRIWVDSPKVPYEDPDGLGLLRTVDGGATWDTLAPPVTGLRSMIVAPDNGNHLYAGRIQYGTDELLFESLDGGENWSVVDISDIYVVEDGVVGVFVPSSNPDHLYVSLVAAGLARTYFRRGSDADWELVMHESIAELAESPDNPDLMAFTSLVASEFYLSEDAGATWQTVALPDSVAGVLRQLEFMPGDPSQVIITTSFEKVYIVELETETYTLMTFPGVDEYSYEPSCLVSDGSKLYTLFSGLDFRYGTVKWVHQFDGEEWMQVGETPFSTDFNLQVAGEKTLLIYHVGLYRLTLR